MQRRGRLPRRWTLDDGRSITGWEIDSNNYSDTVTPSGGSNFRKESWGNSWKILTADGTLLRKHH